MTSLAATSSSSSSSAPVQSKLLLWSAAGLLATANFLAVLDITIANVSVPNIAGNLGVSSSQGLWVITSYAVAEAITVPLTGWLAGRFGALRVFCTAMAGFGLFSALCGLSTSLEMLVLFRVLQGVAGGPLIPLSQTLLLLIFPKKQQPVALALWSMTTLIAPIVGPILGGQLCDNLGWPSIFYVNVPIAFVCAPLSFWLLRSKETPTSKTRVDGIGLLLLVVWVGALQIMLDLGKEHDWFESTMVVWLAIIAIVGFLAFLIWRPGRRYTDQYRLRSGGDALDQPGVPGGRRVLHRGCRRHLACAETDARRQSRHGALTQRGKKTAQRRRRVNDPILVSTWTGTTLTMVCFILVRAKKRRVASCPKPICSRHFSQARAFS